MTRLRRSRLAGAFVALGIYCFVPAIPGRPLSARCSLCCRSFRPRALISPAKAGQVERRFVGGKVDGCVKIATLALDCPDGPFGELRAGSASYIPGINPDRGICLQSLARVLRMTWS